jgi:hypothetical protein
VDVVPLFGVDDRAQRHVVTGRVTDRQPVGVLGEQPGVLVGDPRVYQMAAGGHADLAGVVERPERAHRHRLLQVDVV